MVVEINAVLAETIEEQKETIKEANSTNEFYLKVISCLLSIFVLMKKYNMSTKRALELFDIFQMQTEENEDDVKGYSIVLRGQTTVKDRIDSALKTENDELTKTNEQLTTTVFCLSGWCIGSIIVNVLRWLGIL